MPFATALRARGIDVWLDRWEILPGDSLVDRIFTEGIGRAAAIIVVLSAASVQKRWVTEELDAAVVKRIQDNTRLIPVVLDGLEPTDLPVAIRHLLFEPVPNPNQFTNAVERVSRSVFGKTEKPELGRIPNYATSKTETVAGLDRIDAFLLKAMGDESVRDFGEHFQTAEFVATVRETLGITEQQSLESLEVLDADGYIEISRTLGNGLPSMAHFNLTTSGIETYSRVFVEGYDRMRQTVISRLAGGPQDHGTDEELATATGVPRLLVLHLLRILDSRGLLHLSQPHGPWAHFHSISPKLRRMT